MRLRDCNNFQREALMCTNALLRGSAKMRAEGELMHAKRAQLAPKALCEPKASQLQRVALRASVASVCTRSVRKQRRRRVARSAEGPSDVA